MDSDGSNILLGAALLAVSVIFRGLCTVCETACTETSDAKIKSFEGSSDKKERTLYKILKKPLRILTLFSSLRIFTAVLITFISAAVFYRPLSDTLLGLSGLSSDGAKTGFRLVSAVIIFVLIIFLLTVFTDGIPRRVTALGKKNPADISLGLIGFLKFVFVITLPVSVISEKLITAVSALFGVESSAEKELVTEEDILMLVDAGNENGVIEENQKEMINNVFEFGDLPVSDVMTHRTDISAISDDGKISELVYLAINTGFSRIPVYHESIDHIIGIVCVKDLLCLVGGTSADSMTLKDFIRDVIYFPESGMCGALFEQMTAGKTQIAVVVDEYGGTAGIVSLEDIVESVMGNIQDEYDNEAEDITKISETEYTVDGKANPEEIMDELGCPIEDDSKFDTMSSFFIFLYGRIPAEGEMPSVTYKNVKLTALYAEDMRISRLKAEIIPEKKENDDKESEG